MSISKCSMCGLCKANCPVFLVRLTEKDSPRGKALLIKEDHLTGDFYNCTLCGACTVECPSDIDLELRSMRKKLVEKGKVTKANKELIEKIRKYGNPFGDGSADSKDLYCC